MSKAIIHAKKLSVCKHIDGNIIQSIALLWRKNIDWRNHVATHVALAFIVASGDYFLQI